MLLGGKQWIEEQNDNGGTANIYVEAVFYFEGIYKKKTKIRFDVSFPQIRLRFHHSEHKFSKTQNTGSALGSVACTDFLKDQEQIKKKDT